jgi:hypothetical protein
VIDVLGSVVFATIVGIGVLDMRSGLSPFATFRSASRTDLRRRAPLTEREPAQTASARPVGTWPGDSLIRVFPVRDKRRLSTGKTRRHRADPVSVSRAVGNAHSR